MNRLYTQITSIFAGILFPALTFAQAPDFDYFDTAVVSIGQLVTKLIPILIAIGLLFFIWGLVQFIMAGGDDTAKDKGKSHMVWGVIALFVMVAVWGLVGLLGDVTGIEVGGTIDTPSVSL